MDCSLLSCKLWRKRHHMHAIWERWWTFSVKGRKTHSLGFVGQMVSVAMLLLWHKSSHRQYIRGWPRPCSNKVLWKNRQQARLRLRAVVCQSWVQTGSGRHLPHPWTTIQNLSSSSCLQGKRMGWGQETEIHFPSHTFYNLEFCIIHHI